MLQNKGGDPLNVARLEMLAAHLDQVPPRGFNMLWWVTKGYIPGGSLRELRKAQANDYSCGMAACVGGHAAIVFPKLLTLRHGYLSVPGRLLCDSVTAITETFGLCVNHAEWLTATDAVHQTPKAAAMAIRKLIEKNPPCCQSAEEVISPVQGGTP